MDDLEHMEQELEEVKKDYRDGKDWLDPELARVCRKTKKLGRSLGTRLAVICMSVCLVS